MFARDDNYSTETRGKITVDLNNPRKNNKIIQAYPFGNLKEYTDYKES